MKLTLRREHRVIGEAFIVCLNGLDVATIETGGTFSNPCWSWSIWTFGERGSEPTLEGAKAAVRASLERLETSVLRASLRAAPSPLNDDMISVWAGPDRVAWLTQGVTGGRASWDFIWQIHRVPHFRRGGGAPSARKALAAIAEAWTEWVGQFGVEIAVPSIAADIPAEWPARTTWMAPGYSIPDDWLSRRETGDWPPP